MRFVPELFKRNREKIRRIEGEEEREEEGGRRQRIIINHKHTLLIHRYSKYYGRGGANSQHPHPNPERCGEAKGGG